MEQEEQAMAAQETPAAEEERFATLQTDETGETASLEENEFPALNDVAVQTEKDVLPSLEDPTPDHLVVVVQGEEELCDFGIEYTYDYDEERIPPTTTLAEFQTKCPPTPAVILKQDEESIEQLYDDEDNGVEEAFRNEPSTSRQQTQAKPTMCTWQLWSLVVCIILVILTVLALEAARHFQRDATPIGKG